MFEVSIISFIVVIIILEIAVKLPLQYNLLNNNPILYNNIAITHNPIHIEFVF